jgi:hypothetical protein
MRDVIVKTKLQIIEWHDASYQKLRQTCCLGFDFITMLRPVYIYAERTAQTSHEYVCKYVYSAMKV